MILREPTLIENKTIRANNQHGDAIQIVGAGASDTIIRNCEIFGGIRLWGLAQNGNDLREESRLADHTQRAQDAAPKRVVLENLTIHANRRIPIYLAPGVTGCRISNCTVDGWSISSVVYLDAESAGNVVENCTFDVANPRETLSIDGSAHNTVRDNTFHHSDTGGVYVYRNTGEGGAARHQEPRHNHITGNTFHYNNRVIARPTIWLSFDTLWRALFLSWQDRRIPYGSGKDNADFARENTVTGNKFVRPPWLCFTVLDTDKDNTVAGNVRQK